MKIWFNRFRNYWIEDFSFITLFLMLVFTIFILPAMIELQYTGVFLLNFMLFAIFFIGIGSAPNRYWMITATVLFLLSFFSEYIGLMNCQGSISWPKEL